MGFREALSGDLARSHSALADRFWMVAKRAIFGKTASLFWIEIGRSIYLEFADSHQRG